MWHATLKPFLLVTCLWRHILSHMLCFLSWAAQHVHQGCLSNRKWALLWLKPFGWSKSSGYSQRKWIHPNFWQILGERGVPAAFLKMRTYEKCIIPCFYAKVRWQSPYPEWEICIQFFHVPEKIQTCTFYSSGVSNKQAGPSGVLVLPKGYPLGTNVGVYLISWYG